MSWSQSFGSVVDSRTEVLVLGSMPGQKSLADNQYYAHPRNAFWKIIEALFNIPIDMNYQQRLLALNDARVGLWDVYAQCFRPGSLDADIQADTALVNDFQTLLAEFPCIHTIILNGKAAEKAFKKEVLPALQRVQREVACFTMPSTSPANAAINFEGKLKSWQKLKECLSD